jgi:hypothetical protein
MNPKRLSALNHLTVPVAMPSFQVSCGIRALDEIARTFTPPIRVGLVMSDGKSITGNLVGVKSRQE